MIFFPIVLAANASKVCVAEFSAFSCLWKFPCTRHAKKIISTGTMPRVTTLVIHVSWPRWQIQQPCVTLKEAFRPRPVEQGKTLLMWRKVDQPNHSVELWLRLFNQKCCSHFSFPFFIWMAKCGVHSGDEPESEHMYVSSSGCWQSLRMMYFPEHNCIRCHLKKLRMLKY